MKRGFRKELKQAKKTSDIQMKLQESFEYSQEQKDYIYREFNQNEDSILLAKAGSGKTQCLLDRMRYLAQKQFVTKDQMLVFSFSRMIMEDAKNRCKKYNDSTLFADDRLICTIDAFCWQIIRKVEPEREVCNEQILSAKVHDIIQKEDESYTKLVQYLKKSKYRKIKVLFIDEAQDLNQMQYDIIMFLKKIINCQLNFIGDPNQNIFQFRGSFEKFMLNHEGIRFQLTKNFRSDPQIESFSKYFEYYNEQFVTDVQVQPSGNCNWNSEQIQHNNNNSVEVYVQSQKENDNTIVNILKTLKKEGQQAKNIAFLSAVEGNDYNTGIKRVANLLDLNNITYNAYYNETKDQVKKSNSTAVKQAVNLMSIHKSKGLEFNVVILINFADNNQKKVNYEQSNFVIVNMNLLYVALTRAKQKLIIIHDDQSDMITEDSRQLLHKHICSLIHRVPYNLYRSYGNIQNHLKVIEMKSENRKKLVDEDYESVKNNQINDRREIMLVSKYYQPELLEINMKEGMFQNSQFKFKTGVTKFIQGIGEKNLLDLLDKKLQYKKKSVELYKISDKDANLFKELRIENEALVGILLEQIFFYQIQFHKQQLSDSIDQMPKVYKILFQVTGRLNRGSLKINQFFVISSKSQFNQLMGLIHQINNQPNMTQQQIDTSFRQLQMQNLTDDQYDSLQQKIRRNLVEYLDFGKISLEQLAIINQYISPIFDAINTYNQGLHWREVIDSIIYICSLKYSIKSQHCKYIQYNKNLFEKLRQFDHLFKELDVFAESLKTQEVIYQKEIDNFDIIGFIDFIIIDPETQETTIVEFKTTKDLQDSHILQLIMYDYLLQQQENTDDNNRLVIVNALKGVQYEIKIEQKEELFNYLTDLLQEDKFQRNNVL